MSGNSAFGGTSGGNSAFGGTSGTNTGRGGTTQVGSTSFLGASYANPLAMGLSGSSGTTTTNTAFGNALYNLTTNRNATATVSTSSSNQQNSQYGAGYNIRRLPAYATTLKIKDLPPPPTGRQVRTDLQTMIAQSPDLDPRTPSASSSTGRPSSSRAGPGRRRAPAGSKHGPPHAPRLPGSQRADDEVDWVD